MKAAASSTHTTASSAHTTIQTFHAYAAAAEQRRPELQDVDNEQRFHNMYSSCTPLSTFHDLQCGHRVQTEYTASCGMHCLHPVKGSPFVCPTCLIDVVRAEVALEGLGLKSNNNTITEETGQTQDDKARHFAEQHIAAMLKKGFRSAKAVSKLQDPQLQFFDNFMRQDGFGGLEDEEKKEELLRPRKRPGRRCSYANKKARAAPYPTAQQRGKLGICEPDACVASQAQASVQPSIAIPEDGTEKVHQNGKNVMDGLLEQFANSYIDLPPEDEATEAVRKAMETIRM
jgi:hypothetical protein